MIELPLDITSLRDYQRFLAIKRLPVYEFRGCRAFFPEEYAERIGVESYCPDPLDYEPAVHLFDYQLAITRIAIEKRKFCVFADCGLGKTLVFLEFARHAAMSLPPGRSVLIVSPLMVIPQTLAEVDRFYGDTLPVEQIPSGRLQEWLDTGGHADFRLPNRIGITNYEAMHDDLRQGTLGALILDESSMLKSHYGKWGSACLKLGRGLKWKLAGTGTPAPNDRIEFANHAVFMDAFPSVNAFLARFFVNRGQTGERWEIKPHAVGPFYKALSHWSIFLSNPATYGWSDNATGIPPIHVHIHEVKLTERQRDLAFEKTGQLFANTIGGIRGRSTLGQIAKGHHKGEKIDTLKPAFIRELVDSWPEESTIIWCLYNAEQALLEKWFPEAASLTGATPMDERIQLINEFKAGTRKILISKPKILGFGLNLQIATRQVFSGLQDSYESFYQAVKRSNRVGSTRPLNVHIPVTEIERPMIETVLSKARRVQADTEEQERIFKDAAQ